MKKALSLVAGLALVGALPVLAADDVIGSGVDTWKTVAGGRTFTSFANDPLPADFFCAGSAPFTGKLELRGAKLGTQPAAALEGIDTVIHRLDDARLDADGKGKTRIRFLALSLVSTAPIETDCGRYDVAVSLDGEQPTTEMQIVRTNQYGGYYVAPLALDVKVAFTPVAGDPAARREVKRQIRLGSGTNSVWSYASLDQATGEVKIDTDGDRVPDTLLPTEGSFAAGVAPAVQQVEEFDESIGIGRIDYLRRCPYQSCHCNPDSQDAFEGGDGCSDDHLHCVEVLIDCRLIAIG
jgi:hypothetical protein